MMVVEDFARMLAGLKTQLEAGVRPIGLMHKTIETAKVVRQTWNVSGTLPQRVLERLWRHLHHEGIAARFSKNDCRGLAIVLMQGAGPDFPSFLSEAALFRHGVVQIVEHEHHPAIRMLVAAYFQSYEQLSATPIIGYTLKGAALAGDAHTKHLAELGFFEANGPSAAVKLLRDDELFTETIRKHSNDIILPGSSFCTKVWEIRIPTYTKLVRRDCRTIDQLRKTLSRIRLESIDARECLRTEDLSTFETFAQAIVQPLLEESANDGRALILQKDVETAITAFFTSLIGPKGEGNRELWAFIESLVGPIKQLEEAFDFVDLLLQTQYDRRSWMERQRFWRHYWRAGRIKHCRVFVAASRKLYLRYTYRDRYPHLVDSLGTLSGLNKMQVMVLMEVSGNASSVLVCEFSHTGALRINTPTELVNMSRHTIDFMYVQLFGDSEGGVRIPHNQQWRAATHAALRKLTGSPSPANL